jgi:D-alanine-D-alanine ligase
MTDMAARVGVIFGGPSPEHDVSVLTGLQVAECLRQSSGIDEVFGLYWAKNGAFFAVRSALEAEDFLDGVPKDSSPLELCVGPSGGFLAHHGLFGRRSERLGIDAVVVCCHGGPGEDGALQGTLDLAGISYTGPSACGAALGMDKLASGALVSELGLTGLPRFLLSEDMQEPSVPPPYIVKPRFGGSSIGIEVVADLMTAKARLHANVHLRRGAVLEPYRPDCYDLQIAVRSWPKWELSAIERPLRHSSDAAFLNYADKYVGGEGMSSAPRELPADIPEECAKELRAATHVIARAFGVRGVARIDFLFDGSRLYVNELNTIPGSLGRYLFENSHADVQLSFAELLNGMLEEAVHRSAAQFSAAGADGSVLRDAGAIAAKLA